MCAARPVPPAILNLTSLIKTSSYRVSLYLISSTLPLLNATSVHMSVCMSICLFFTLNKSGYKHPQSAFKDQVRCLEDMKLQFHTDLLTASYKIEYLRMERNFPRN